MADTDEKSGSPFDAESEEDTIALSKDELDNILSGAEIVQENRESDSGTRQEKTRDKRKRQEKQDPDASEEGEFDISGEIDELSPEDLENIELEESDIEQYSQELESELGEELELPELEDEEARTDESDEEPGDAEESLDDAIGVALDDSGNVDLEEAEESFEETAEESLEDAGGESLEGDEGEVRLEGSFEEDMDLDAYLDSVKSDVELDDIDLEEEGPVETEEEPSMGTSPESPEDAFKEAGIEGVEEDVEMSDEELLKGLEEAGLTPREEEEEYVISEDEEPTLAFDAENEEQLETTSLEEEPFESDIDLTDEEERILNEDLDLEAEKLETEEVVTVSGEELGRMAEEDTLPEPGVLEKEVTADQPGNDRIELDRTLYNDVTVILKYMDDLLGDLPEEKIKEFARSKYFSLYKEVFDKLNLS